jgi:hypothetical protein
VLSWILFYGINSCLGSSSSDYIDVLPIIPSLCKNPLDIHVVLVPFLLDISQESWAVLCAMVCCATMHTCCRWKWTIPFIISWLLEVVAHYWSSVASKSSSSSSNTYVSSSISSWCIVLGYLVILRRIIWWLCVVVLRFHIVVLRLHIVVWWWYLDEMRCNLSCHHFFLHPVSV